MSKHFTHLHLHTDYSLLDGAITLDRLIDFGKKHNFKALAITDHGNIFGAVKFFQKCKKAGIKPILGIEAYLTEDATVKDTNNKYYHQILLVQNKEGYRNLCKLIAYSFQQGFYFKPRIDYAMLEKHSAGLIVTSACLGGHIAKLIKSNDTQALHDRLDWFLRVFGPDRYYLEVQPEDQAEQVELNRALYALSAEKNIKLVAAGDCHYVQADDREAHEIMLAIQTQDKIDNPNRYTFGDCRVHMRTAEEMLEIFHEHPEAVWNSGVIADMCEFDFETDKLFFPRFEIPEEHTQDSFFKYMCQKGLQQLYDDELIPVEEFEAYQARLNLEVDLIISMGFVGYFLVVSDFIQWAHRNGIPVGPGRGSAAGSLVAWTLQITNIDPLKYNLLFERFLNPERITMPDIDIDFCIEGREKVIDYIRDKYGHDKVCQIITFGTMLAKGVIKDVARSLGLPFEDSNAITNLIPDQLKITLAEAVEQEPRLKNLMEGNPKVQKIFDVAFKLEGLTRHASKHAAGIVISPDPIDEVLPVYVPAKSNELVAQYAMSELESIGFLKIDLLGLKNLTLIRDVIALVHKHYAIQININKLPLNDPKTFALICAGNTSGVFQLESEGLKEVLRKLQPDKFEDIIAVNALYRPGPLGSGMVDDYIERRHGRQSIKYLFPELESILQETYGVIVYQEQVMKIASAIAGYSLGESDILRRAMGKKKAEVMAEQSELFVTRAQERNFDPHKARELFDLMAYFAGYGFNKSHSAAYALIAYQTAYLKANYPAEFMACLISLEATNPEKMSFYLQEAKSMGISILSPDINTSQIEFSVVNGAILFGLQGIKNVGLAALENILQERNKKGPFKNLLDFCKRVDLRTVNKRVIENLICAGAFDSLPGNRAQQFEEAQQVMDIAAAYKKDTATGQMGLFGMTNQAVSGDEQGYVFAVRKEWSDKEKLEKEQAVIGFYLSSHPLDAYRQQLNWFNLVSFEKILEQVKASNGQEKMVVVSGMVQARKDIMTKKGDRMAFVQLEDATSTAEMVIFPKTFTKVEQWLDAYNVFVVKGFVDAESKNKCKIKVQDMVPVELVLQEWSQIQSILLTLVDVPTEEQIEKLKASLVTGAIPLEFIFHENGKKLHLSTKMKIGIDQQILSMLEKEYRITAQCVL
jgi:DNA polymerase-3 subunit alpha